MVAVSRTRVCRLYIWSENITWVPCKCPVKLQARGISNMAVMETGDTYEWLWEMSVT